MAECTTLQRFDESAVDDRAAHDGSFAPVLVFDADGPARLSDGPAGDAGPVAPPPSPAAAAPAPATTGALVLDALEALERGRWQEREALRERLRRLEKFNMYCHAAGIFVHELATHSGQFSYSTRSLDEPRRLWSTCLLSIGHGKYRRIFPISTTLDRELGYDVTLVVDLDDIGATRDERIMRAEQVGGRAMSTPFGWTFTALCPRDISDAEEVLRWLRGLFANVFRLAYDRA